MTNEDTILCYSMLTERSLENRIKEILSGLKHSVAIGAIYQTDAEAGITSYVIADIRRAAMFETERETKRMIVNAKRRAADDGYRDAMKTVLGWLDAGYVTERQIRNLATLSKPPYQAAP